MRGGGTRIYVVKRILCPVDFSEASFTALRAAADLARQLSAELIVLHVVVPLVTPIAEFGGQEANIERLHDAQAAMAGRSLRGMVDAVSDEGIRVRALDEIGEVVATILRAAADEVVDLIVMSTHGRTGWHRLLLGSVTEKLLRHAECPVMAIHPDEQQPSNEGRAD
jgi:universal stress protein A